MIKFTVISGVVLLLATFAGSPTANAQDSLPAGPSTKSFLACAKQCEKSFYFSEQSDSNFAVLRNACIEGCASVVDAKHGRLSKLQRRLSGHLSLQARHQC